MKNDVAEEEESFWWAAPTGAAITIGLLVLVVLAAAFGGQFVKDFLLGAASGWVQAIGSIAAIGIAFKLGQDAHLKQVERDAQAEADRKTEAIEALRAVFQCLQTFEKFISRISDGTMPYPQLYAGVQDASAMLKEIPVMSLPNADLILFLTLARQAAVSYAISLQTAVEKKYLLIDPFILQLQNHALVGLSNTQDAIAHCDNLLAGFKKQKPIAS